MNLRLKIAVEHRCTRCLTFKPPQPNDSNSEHALLNAIIYCNVLSGRFCSNEWVAAPLPAVYTLGNCPVCTFCCVQISMSIVDILTTRRDRLFVKFSLIPVALLPRAVPEIVL